MSLLDEICIGFHDLPKECWTPQTRGWELRQERFWLEHLYAVELAAEDAVAAWIPEAKWPALDERTAYFLRVQLEHIHRLVASELGSDIRAEGFGFQDDESARRRSISRLLSAHWTRDEARSWATEAAHYGSPRRVYLRDPR